jgi:hypothetical protein
LKAVRKCVGKLAIKKRMIVNSDEESIGFELEGYNRAGIIGKYILNMGESLIRGSLRGVGWYRVWVECGADMGLAMAEAFPDTPAGSVAEMGADGADGGVDGGGGGVFEEGPEGVSGEAEASDAVGEEDAEGVAAAGAAVTVATEDAVCTPCFAMGIGVVEAVEVAVLDECSGGVAVGATGELELLDDGGPLFVVVVEAWDRGHGGACPAKSLIVPAWRGAR